MESFNETRQFHIGQEFGGVTAKKYVSPTVCIVIETSILHFCEYFLIFLQYF